MNFNNYKNKLSNKKFLLIFIFIVIFFAILFLLNGISKYYKPKIVLPSQILKNINNDPPFALADNSKLNFNQLRDPIYIQIKSFSQDIILNPKLENFVKKLEIICSENNGTLLFPEIISFLPYKDTDNGILIDSTLSFSCKNSKKIDSLDIEKINNILSYELIKAYKYLKVVTTTKQRYGNDYEINVLFGGGQEKGFKDFHIAMKFDWFEYHSIWAVTIIYDRIHQLNK